MGAPQWTFLPDLLEEHLEELGFLWGQWSSAQRSPLETRRTVAELEERIQAHLQGVLAVGFKTLPRLSAGLNADDPVEVFACAYALLHWRDRQVEDRVLDALIEAKGPRLKALQTALAYAPSVAGRNRLTDLVAGKDANLAVTAALILARQRTLQLSSDQLQRFLLHEDPAVRGAAWQLVGQLGAMLDAKAYARALRDDDAAVRLAALEAGAWCGERGVLPALRHATQKPAPDVLDILYLLAVLGTGEDLKQFGCIADLVQLGPARFRMVGAFGHPALMDRIIAELASDDPASAAAAGAAFEKMTGVNIDSGRVVPASSTPPADDFEAEFQDEVMLPDPARAAAHWSAVRGRFAQATRICHGVDLAQPLDAATFAAFDMESRWETWLRSRFYGAWSGTPLDLEVFAQSVRRP